MRCVTAPTSRVRALRSAAQAHCSYLSGSTGTLQSSRRGLLTSGMLLTPALFGGKAMARPAQAVSEAEKVLLDPKWPKQFPFKSDDFRRYDESPDSFFYADPRFVYHIDENAVKALTEYYAKVFPASGNKDVAILDICSSWVSHYPEGYTAGRIAGLGMNGDELKRNPQLTEYTVKDLNVDPSLPYEDNSFDVITNCVSVDYLSQPLQVFKEIHRVLKPGGTAIMSFSNRCFPTKAIAIWTVTGDLDHIWIVGSYFHYSVPGGFTEPAAKDITLKRGGDPMYVVFASKAA